MQFGLFMMPLHPPHRAFADGYDRDVDQIVLADRLGFREAWVGEHLTERWENAPAPDLLIAKALALTKHDAARDRRDAPRAAQSRLPRASAGHARPHGARPLPVGHRRRRHPDRSLAAGSRPRAIPPPCAPARPRCWTSCSSSGRRTARSRITASSSTSRRPSFDPVKDRGYYMKPYQQPHPPIAVAASTPESDSMRMAGERGWIPMSSSLLSRAYLPTTGGWSRTARRRPGRPADAEPVAHRARRPRRADPGGGARAGARRDGTQLRAAPAPQSRRHHPDGVDQARPVHARRGGHGRLPDGATSGSSATRRNARRRSTSSTRRAAASARCCRSRRTRTMPAGTTRACAS